MTLNFQVLPITVSAKQTWHYITSFLSTYLYKMILIFNFQVFPIIHLITERAVISFLFCFVFLVFAFYLVYRIVALKKTSKKVLCSQGSNVSTKHWRTIGPLMKEMAFSSWSTHSDFSPSEYWPHRLKIFFWWLRYFFRWVLLSFWSATSCICSSSSWASIRRSLINW